MAIIGAVVGAGAVIGVATAASDPHSDYSEYSNYSDYDNYSDAAERRRRREAAKRSEIDSKKYEINDYKTEKVNEYLKSQKLINQSGVEVSVDGVRLDADQKLKGDADQDFRKEGASLQTEIQAIDSVISKIDKILEEE